MGVTEDIKHAGAMRFMGWFLIILSVVEFGLGGAVYGYLTNVHLGAWWGAICSFIAGICGAASNTRSAVITGMVFSIFAVIVSIVGAIVDGIAGGVIEGETACVNTHTFDRWGTDEGIVDAGWCALGWSSYAHKSANAPDVASAAVSSTASKITQAFYNYNYNRPYYYNNNFFFNHPSWIFYYNQNHNDNWYSHHNSYYWNNHPYNRLDYGYDNEVNNYNNFYSYTYSYQCVCTDDTLCYGYDLASGENCGGILTTYLSLLSASTAFLAILCVASLIYSILTCSSCCGSSSIGSSISASREPVTVQPVSQIQMTPSAAPAMYVQPGMMMQQPAMPYHQVPGGGQAPVGYAYAAQGYAPQQMQMQQQSQQPYMATAQPYGGQPYGQPSYMPQIGSQPMGQPLGQPVMYAPLGAAGGTVTGGTAMPLGYAPVSTAMTGTADAKFV